MLIFLLLITNIETNFFVAQKVTLPSWHLAQHKKIAQKKIFLL